MGKGVAPRGLGDGIVMMLGVGRWGEGERGMVNTGQGRGRR